MDTQVVLYQRSQELLYTQ